MNSKIIGSGKYVPPHEADNKTLGNFFPKSLDGKWTPEWVDEKLGILKRRNAFDFEKGKMHSGGPCYDGDYAYEAARSAIADAGLEPKDIDRVIYLTSTPECLMPDPACVLHMRLGMRDDASAIAATAVGCGGFVYGMDMADSDIRSGKYRTVLVVGSVAVGSYIPSFISSDDPEERERLLRLSMPNIYIFGDGAGALVLQATEEDSGILHSYLGANGNNNPVVYAGGGSRYPATHETVYSGMHRFNMDTGLVRDVGPVMFERCVKGILEKSGIDISCIDNFLFHQVNARLLKVIARSLGVPFEKVETHVQYYGNLDTATLPVAYSEARKAGRIKEGNLVLFAAIGAGWQYGAVIVKI